MSLRPFLASIAVLLSVCCAPDAQAHDLAVAWLRDGRVEVRADPAAAPTDAVPLGSLWKLFVYAYAVERKLDVPAYQCGASRIAGEEYCCEPGGTIDLDQALARSCGLAFEPQRLEIDAAAWRDFWAPKVRERSQWLTELGNLAPAHIEPVEGVLQAVEAVPATARASAMRALLPVMVDGGGRDALPHLGSLARVKTFTWEHERRPGSAWGGAAGWLIDGTPVWFGASGSSRSVLREHGQRIAQRLPALRDPIGPEACVVVDFFARYPIRSVDRLPEKVAAASGVLSGRYRVTFENGNTLLFNTGGEMRLDDSDGRPGLKARLSLTEYLARVIDREGDASVSEAARALAIVARSWLIENAVFDTGCYRVEDSSRAQRVSASPASRAARQVVLFTDGLVLGGQPAQYRLQSAVPGVLSWTDAVDQARAGDRFDVILANAFPSGTLGTVNGEQECRRLPDAERWLAKMLPRWHRQLASEPGFEPLSRPPAVCLLQQGTPYADTSRLRVFARALRTPDDRIALAHEYVHLAFRFHPLGADEAFVERLARRLEEN